MNPVTIREVRPDDAARLLEIYGYYVEHTAISFEYDVPSREEFSARIKGTIERYPYLVAERDGAVLGYAYAGPFHSRAAYRWACELTVYLDPRAKGQGLGRMLYQALEKELAAMGVQNLYACIAYPEMEDEYLTRASAAFHVRIGFRESGRIHRCGYKFGRGYDMVWMEKLIGDHPACPPPVARWKA